MKGLISIRKRLKGKRIKINILNDKWDTHNICQQGMLYDITYIFNKIFS